MNLVMAKYIVALLFCTLLLFSSSASSENINTKQKTIYRVDFNYPENNNSTEVNSQTRINTDNDNLKILLYGKGAALLLEPGIIKNTKLQLNDSNQSLKTEINNLKNQGINFIVCEHPIKGLSSNLENDFNNPEMQNSSAAARLQHLKNLGYLCIKP